MFHSFVKSEMLIHAKYKETGRVDLHTITMLMSMKREMQWRANVSTCILQKSLKL